VSSRFFKVFIHSFCIQMMVAETNFKYVLISTLEEYVFRDDPTPGQGLCFMWICIVFQSRADKSGLSWLISCSNLSHADNVLEMYWKLYRGLVHCTVQLCFPPCSAHHLLGVQPITGYQGIQFNFQVWASAATVLAPGGSMYRI
jgi:hypothetical protein